MKKCKHRRNEAEIKGAEEVQGRERREERCTEDSVAQHRGYIGIIFLLYRVKIVKENALPDIENYMFEENEQLRQAATECMCNLVTCKEVRVAKSLKTSSNTDSTVGEDINRCGFKVQQRYMEDGNDKMKLLVLLCGEDDEDLQIAAAGALAMLTAAQKKLCTKLTQVVSPATCDCVRCSLVECVHISCQSDVVCFLLVVG